VNYNKKEGEYYLHNSNNDILVKGSFVKNNPCCKWTYYYSKQNVFSIFDKSNALNPEQYFKISDNSKYTGLFERYSPSGILFKKKLYEHGKLIFSNCWDWNGNEIICDEF
jgi:hypothetical protein